MKITKIAQDTVALVALLAGLTLSNLFLLGKVSQGLYQMDQAKKEAFAATKRLHFFLDSMGVPQLPRSQQTGLHLKEICPTFK